MKTAKDWTEIIWNTRPAYSKVDDFHYKALPEIIARIQLEAWKQGMTDAAEFLKTKTYHDQEGFCAFDSPVDKLNYLEILDFRDSKTSL